MPGCISRPVGSLRSIKNGESGEGKAMRRASASMTQLSVDGPSNFHTEVDCDQVRSVYPDLPAQSCWRFHDQCVRSRAEYLNRIDELAYHHARNESDVHLPPRMCSKKYVGEK